MAKTFLIQTKGLAYAYVYSVQAETSEEAEAKLPELTTLCRNEQVVDVHEVDPSKPGELAFCIAADPDADD